MVLGDRSTCWFDAYKRIYGADPVTSSTVTYKAFTPVDGVTPVYGSTSSTSTSSNLIKINFLIVILGAFLYFN